MKHFRNIAGYQHLPAVLSTTASLPLREHYHCKQNNTLLYYLQVPACRELIGIYKRCIQEQKG